MDKKLIFGGVVAGMLVTLGGAVSAQSNASATMSEEKAIEIALAEVPGTVQEAELETEDGKKIYEIEILTADGVEMEVEIDVATGTVLEVEAEDEDGDDHDDDREDDGGVK